jgi:gluconate 2-dehydrogenase
MSVKPKIFVDQPIPAPVAAYLAEHCQCAIRDNREPMTPEEIAAAVADVQGLLVSKRSINQALLDSAPQLKAVSTMSVGYNHFDLSAMRARGVVGMNTPGVLDETVADLAFALILSTARRIAELDRYVRAGLWHKYDNESLFGVDVHHAQLGIIGMGRIGEAIARRAKFGFSMNVSYHTRTRKLEAEEQLGVVYQSMDELLSTADFVLLMTPLTPETVGLIGREQFAKMKSNAIFINTSRGQTVDEAALIEALQLGRIRGAGLDVFEQEPVAADNPLLQMPNVVALPHIGSATAQTRLDMAMLAARNLVDALHGRTPLHTV